MITMLIHFTADYPPISAHRLALLAAGSIGGRLVSCVGGLGVIETPQAERAWAITPLTLEEIAGITRVEVQTHA